jgi:hypothetical protein
MEVHTTLKSAEIGCCVSGSGGARGGRMIELSPMSADASPEMGHRVIDYAHLEGNTECYPFLQWPDLRNCPARAHGGWQARRIGKNGLCTSRNSYGIDRETATAYVQHSSISGQNAFLVHPLGAPTRPDSARSYDLSYRAKDHATRLACQRPLPNWLRLTMPWFWSLAAPSIAVPLMLPSRISPSKK